MKNEESLHIKYSQLFKKQLREASINIKVSLREAREMFLYDPNHPALRNHALHGKYAGFRSIDVTEDWRALFKIRKSKLKTVITFHILGTHDQLYE